MCSPQYPHFLFSEVNVWKVVHSKQQNSKPEARTICCFTEVPSNSVLDYSISHPNGSKQTISSIKSKKNLYFGYRHSQLKKGGLMGLLGVDNKWNIIPFDLITEVLRDHQTAATLHSSDIIDPQLCFSILIGSRSIDFVASSAEEAENWYCALSNVIHASPSNGKSKIEVSTQSHRGTNDIWGGADEKDCSEGELAGQSSSVKKDNRELATEGEGNIAQDIWSAENLNSYYETAIFEAIYNNSVQDLTLAFEEGCDPSITSKTTVNDIFGPRGSRKTVLDNALTLSCRLNNLPLLRVAISYGVPFYPENDNSLTALHAAVIVGSVDCVEELLRVAANTEGYLAHVLGARDSEGNTPLHLAAALGFARICEILLERSSNEPLLRNKEGATPLHLACRLAPSSCPSMYASSSGPSRPARTVIEPPFIMSGGALMYPLEQRLAVADYGETVAVLMDAGADLVFQWGDAAGLAPIHYAALHHSGLVLESLLGTAANPLLITGDPMAIGARNSGCSIRLPGRGLPSGIAEHPRMLLGLNALQLVNLSDTSIYVTKTDEEALGVGPRRYEKQCAALVSEYEGFLGGVAEEEFVLMPHEIDNRAIILPQSDTANGEEAAIQAGILDEPYQGLEFSEEYLRNLQLSGVPKWENDPVQSVNSANSAIFTPAIQRKSAAKTTQPELTPMVQGILSPETENVTPTDTENSEEPYGLYIHPWQECFHEGYNWHPYWYNIETGDSTWEMPKHVRTYLFLMYGSEDGDKGVLEGDMKREDIERSAENFDVTAAMQRAYHHAGRLTTLGPNEYVSSQTSIEKERMDINAASIGSPAVVTNEVPRLRSPVPIPISKLRNLNTTTSTNDNTVEVGSINNRLSSPSLVASSREIRRGLLSPSSPVMVPPPSMSSLNGDVNGEAGKSPALNSPGRLRLFQRRAQGDGPITSPLAMQSLQSSISSANTQGSVASSLTNPSSRDLLHQMLKARVVLPSQSESAETIQGTHIELGSPSHLNSDMRSPINQGHSAGRRQLSAAASASLVVASAAASKSAEAHRILSPLRSPSAVPVASAVDKGDEKEKNSDNVDMFLNPDHLRFVRMLRAGVPLVAVLHAMRAQAVPEQRISSFEAQVNAYIKQGHPMNQIGSIEVSSTSSTSNTTAVVSPESRKMRALRVDEPSSANVKSEEQEIPILERTELQKFLRMLRAGVPLGGVLHGMRTQSVPDSVVSSFEDAVNSFTSKGGNIREIGLISTNSTSSASATGSSGGSPKSLPVRRSIMPSEASSEESNTEGSSRNSSSTTPTAPLPPPGKSYAEAQKEALATVESDALYEKYVKMKKMGIPLGAVRGKMMQEGLSSDQQRTFLTAFASVAVLESMGFQPPPGVGAAAEPAAANTSEVTAASKSSRKLKIPTLKLHWDPLNLNEEAYRRSLWGQLQEQGTAPSNSSRESAISTHSTDGGEKESEVDDIQFLEQLFSAKPRGTGTGTTATAAAGAKARAEAEIAEGSLTGLDFKRANNLNISLAQLRRFPSFKHVIEAVFRMDSEELPRDVLEKLSLVLPQPEELQAVQAVLTRARGDDSRLMECDRWFLAVGGAPRFALKLAAFSGKASVEATVLEVKRRTGVLAAACKGILTSKRLQVVLGAVLTIGNALNQGTKHLEAAAISLDSLLKLATMKGADKKTTLLDALVMLIDKKDAANAGSGERENELLIHWCDDIPDITAAARIEPSSLKAEVAKLKALLATTAQEADFEEKDIAEWVRADEAYQQSLRSSDSNENENKVEDAVIEKSKEESLDPRAAMLAEMMKRRAGNVSSSAANGAGAASSNNKKAAKVAPPNAHTCSIESRRKFVSAAREFTATANRDLELLESEVADVEKAATDLVFYFGEEPASVSCTKVFSVLAEFSSGFNKSVETLQRRKQAEARNNKLSGTVNLSNRSE